MPQRRTKLEDDALRYLNKALRSYDERAEQLGYEGHCECYSSYEDDFIVSFRIFRKNMLRLMKNCNTQELDSHKIATLIMLAVLDSKPWYLVNEKESTKYSWLANEILSYIAMKEVVQDHQVKDYNVDSQLQFKLREALPILELPPKLYEQDPTMSTLMDSLARISTAKNRRATLIANMMSLSFKIFFIDSHNRPYVDNAYKKLTA